MNMRERPRVALDIVDPENTFRFLFIRGRVVEITEEGANKHRDRSLSSTSRESQYAYLPSSYPTLFHRF
jgi:hypothetical protein